MSTRGHLRRSTLAAVLIVTVASAACAGRDESSDRDTGAEIDLARGEAVYGANCAMCHGADLRGTTRGPSQLSKVYEPSHHADGAYRAAIRNGVRAHHWNFGNMPPVGGLSDADVQNVIAYIRSEQAKQGFEPYPPPK